MAKDLTETLAEAVNLSTGATLATAGAMGVILAPQVGLVANVYGSLASAYLLPAQGANIAVSTVALGLSPFFYAQVVSNRRKSASIRGTKKYRGLQIGPLRATEKDLFTSVLVLGATGSGKTSRILFPALEDLINTYNADDPDPKSKNPYQKMGGFVLEVKGKFFETIVYLVHQAGRNSATDVRVVRATSTLPLIEFTDETGRKFYLNGQPCSTGSEVSRLYKNFRFADGASVDANMFKRLRASDRELRTPELQSVEIPVTEDIRFVGWRWRRGRLHRVARTLKHDDPEMTGEVISPPKTLRYSRTIYLSNGLQYNLIDPRVPSSEAANRIAMLAKMTTGEGKGGGDNAFFYQAAQKVVEYAILLCRAINPTAQVTVLDLNRIITQDTAQSSAISRLQDMKNALVERRNREERNKDQFAASETTKIISQLDDLAKWWTESWGQTKKTNTGSSITETISNLFGPFMRDPALQETFCNSATFSFGECMSHGTIFAFVPGSEYETMSRTLGTVLKMDFQSQLLKRTSEGADTLNTNRIILHMADECQSFIISGSQDAGDPKFMSLSRESKVINFAATQSEAWVYSAISKEEARVWLQSYRTRVWLTQTDTSTNDEASKLCGKIKEEKRTTDEKLSVTQVLSNDGQAKQKFEYHEKPRFESHEFTQLKDDEAIVFNNGEGLKDLNLGGCPAVKGAVPWRKITSDEGVEAVADRMRWWLVETWENELFRTNQQGLIDPGSPQKKSSPPPEVTSPVAPHQNSSVQVGAPSAEISEPKPEESSQKSDNQTPTTPPKTDENKGGAGGAGIKNPIPTPKVGVVEKGNPSRPAVPLNPELVPPGASGFIQLTGEVPIEVKEVAQEKGNAPTPSEKAPTVPLPTTAQVTQEATSDSQDPTATLTPAQIAEQSKAYQSIIAECPFLLVQYSDPLQLAKQSALTPVAKVQVEVMGNGSLAGGNEATLSKNLPSLSSKPATSPNSPPRDLEREVNVKAVQGMAGMHTPPTGKPKTKPKKTTPESWTL